MANFGRLRKIVEHLRHGKLAHQVFDFSTTNTAAFEDHVCGTNGCAVGEFPAIWPRTFYWPKLGGVRFIKKSSFEFTSTLAAAWLDLEISEVTYLFYPQESKLGDYANRYQVADHIERYILEKEK